MLIRRNFRRCRPDQWPPLSLNRFSTTLTDLSLGIPLPVGQLPSRRKRRSGSPGRPSRSAIAKSATFGWRNEQGTAAGMNDTTASGASEGASHPRGSEQGIAFGRPLPPALLYRSCDSGELPFDLCSELEEAPGLIGQERAAEALRFALRMRGKGYNVYALGASGTGRHTMVERLLREKAEGEPTPPDWCYVNNFADPQQPRRLQLPPGRGAGLAAAMKRLVAELRAALPAAFERDEYRARREAIEQQFRQRSEEAFGALQQRAAAQNITLLRTPTGLGSGADARRQGDAAGSVQRAAASRARAHPARDRGDPGRTRSGNAAGAAVGARAPRGGAGAQPRDHRLRDRPADGRNCGRITPTCPRWSELSRRRGDRHQRERRRFPDAGARRPKRRSRCPGRSSARSRMRGSAAIRSTSSSTMAGGAARRSSMRTTRRIRRWSAGSSTSPASARSSPTSTC